jgi:hypothetical protein
MEKFKMDRKRLQKLAGIITENSISESIPQNAMKQIPQNVMKMGFKYVLYFYSILNGSIHIRLDFAQGIHDSGFAVGGDVISPLG